MTEARKIARRIFREWCLANSIVIYPMAGADLVARIEAKLNGHGPLIDALVRAREAVNAIVLSTHSVSFDADLRAIDLALEGMNGVVSGGKESL